MFLLWNTAGMDNLPRVLSLVTLIDVILMLFVPNKIVRIICLFFLYGCVTLAVIGTIVLFMFFPPDCFKWIHGALCLLICYFILFIVWATKKAPKRL